MRLILSIFALFLITLYAGCSSSSPAPATIDGKWTYTTTDGKIKVTFELTTSTSGDVTIKNPASITVNGTSGDAAAQITGVSMPNIGTIIINANSPALVYSHSITFTTCKFVNTTNKIDVSTGSYTIYSAGNSGGTTNTFASVSIIRP